MCLRLWTYWVFASCFWCAGLFAQSDFYDESNDSGNNARPHYQLLEKLLRYDPLSPPERIRKALEDSPFGDKSSIHTSPWIISSSEVQRIRTGTRQIARALSEFAKDMIFSGSRIQESGILPLEVYQSLLPRLVDLRQAWKGRSLLDLNFNVAPDIMRAPDKEFRVIEINIGPVGGLADNENIRRLYRKFHPALGPEFNLESPDTNAYSERIVQNFRLDGAHQIGFQIWNYPGIQRLTEHQCVMPNSSLHHWRIGEAWEKLGAQLISQGSEFKDPSQIRFFSSLMTGDQFRSRPQLNMDELTSFLENKILLPYIEEMIRFYLGEEPVIKIQPSALVRLRLDRRGDRLEAVDPRISLSLDGKQLVLKRPDANQGRGVLIANFQREELIRDLAASTASPSPESNQIFVQQEYLEASRLQGHRVDLRPIALVTAGENVLVNNLPWGRVQLSRDPQQSKYTNISQGAKQLIILEATKKCERSLHDLGIALPH